MFLPIDIFLAESTFLVNALEDSALDRACTSCGCELSESCSDYVSSMDFLFYRYVSIFFGAIDEVREEDGELQKN